MIILHYSHFPLHQLLKGQRYDVLCPVLLNFRVRLFCTLHDSPDIRVQSHINMNKTFTRSTRTQLRRPYTVLYKTKQNKTKQNKTKQNKTKQNLTGLISPVMYHWKYLNNSIVLLPLLYENNCRFHKSRHTCALRKSNSTTD